MEADQTAAKDFIATHAAELAALAEKLGLAPLAFILQMAALEANDGYRVKPQNNNRKK